jgi:hypothetical protein
MLNEAVDHALHEVQAARRDLTLTTFCVRQAEALRRLDRAKATVAALMQSRNHYPSYDNASIPRVAG